MKQQQLYKVTIGDVIIMIADAGTIHYCLQCDITLNENEVEWCDELHRAVIEKWSA